MMRFLTKVPPGMETPAPLLAPLPGLAPSSAEKDDVIVVDDVLPPKKFRLDSDSPTPRTSSAKEDNDDNSNNDDDGDYDDDDDDEEDRPKPKPKKTPASSTTTRGKPRKIDTILSPLLNAPSLAAANQQLRELGQDKLLQAAQALLANQFTSPEQKTAGAENLKKLLAKNLKASLTWKQSCKTGAATYRFSTACSESEFVGVFGAQTGGKKLDARKMPVNDFFRAIGKTVAGSTRYGSLDPYGEVAIRYHKETHELTVSGHYRC